VKRQNEILAKDGISEEDHLPFFPSIIENITVSFGSKAVLKCEVENLKNYKVAWVRLNTQRILTVSTHVITRDPRMFLSRSRENKWYLHIDSVQDRDRGWYMCQINTDPMMYRSVYLEVVVPPKINQQLTSSSNLVVREGDNVTLVSNATGHPSPKITWRRVDGEDIIIHGRKVNNIEKAQLVIERISRLNMGDYLCVASNGVPPTDSKRFSIRVQFPPTIFVPSQLVAVSVGQDITIECRTEAYPKSIIYWVNSEGAMIISSEKYEAVSVDTGYKSIMKLHIRNVTKNDIMDYRCVAKNSLGQSDGFITLNGPDTSESHENSLRSSQKSSTSSCFSIFCFLFVPNKRSIEYYYLGK